MGQRPMDGRSWQPMHARTPDRAIRVGVGAAALLLFIGSAALTGLSLLSFDAVKRHLDALAADGRAGPITPAWFARMALACRLAAAGLLAAGALLYRLRARVPRYAGELAASFTSLAADVRRSLRAIVKTEEPLHLVAFGVILLVAVVLRLLFLSQPVRYDEAFTFTSWASKPFYVAMSHYAANNHVLHSLLMHASVVVFGDALWAIRLPAFTAGILLVPAAYLTMRAVYGKDAALLATAWVAAASPLVEYSANGRGYTLVWLGFILSWMTARSLTRHHNLFAWWLLVGLGALSGYTMPTALYPIGAVFMWLALSALVGDTAVAGPLLLRRVGLAALLMILITVALFSPVVLSPRDDMIFGVVTPAPWAQFSAQLPEFFAEVWRLWNADLARPVSAAWLLGVVAALGFHRRLTTDRVPMVVAAALWCLPVLLLHRLAPPPRLVVVFSPLYVGLASAGLVYLLSVVAPAMRVSRRRISTICSMVAVVLCVDVGWRVIRTQSVQSVNWREHFSDAERVTDFLKGYLQEGDAVLAAVPASAPLEYYFMRRGIPRTHLSMDPHASRRVLLVVHEPQDDTFSMLLEHVRAATPAFSAPTPLRRYPASTLYELRR